MLNSDWSSDVCSSDLLAQQLRQAAALLHHAYRQVPFYRDRLAEAGFVPGKPVTPAVWARIPVLTRSELQQAGTALHSPEVPESHGGRYEISSSGSTGRPVKAQGTQLARSEEHTSELQSLMRISSAVFCLKK